MFKRTLTQSDYFLIAANLLPVVGVFAWRWSAKEVFLAYCMETIIIGLFTLIKMGMVTIVRKSDNWYNGPGNTTKQHGLFFMVFFTIHYGMFVAIQMGIFFGVSGIGSEQHITIFNFIYKWPQLISKDTLIMLGAFVFCYGFKMIIDFVYTGLYKTIPLMVLMFQPYMRIFVQQFTVIVGSIFLSFGAGKIFVLIFAIIKIIFEVYLNYDNILQKGVKDMEKEGLKSSGE